MYKPLSVVKWSVKQKDSGKISLYELKTLITDILQLIILYFLNQYKNVKEKE